MNDLIDLVAQKAGISPDQARAAVDTVAAYLKDNLPGPLAVQLDTVLGGGSAEGRSIGDAIKHLRAGMGGS
jgi:hypothetical protein